MSEMFRYVLEGFRRHKLPAVLALIPVLLLLLVSAPIDDPKESASGATTISAVDITLYRTTSNTKLSAKPELNAGQTAMDVSYLNSPGIAPAPRLLAVKYNRRPASAFSETPINIKNRTLRL